MPGAGGLSVANNLLANNIQLNLNQNQASLKKLTQELSTGLRINGPSDDPSGFAISTDLQTQVNGFDQASQNIQDANNAVTVASGALTSITGILQQVRTLAVEASSNLLSSSDLNNVQLEIQQLVSEVNSISQKTQFNGINLLDGSYAGYQPATNASVSINQNSALNSSSNKLLASLTYSATDATIADGTFEFQVVQSGATVATQVFYISSGVNGIVGTLLTTISGGAAASFTYAYGSGTSATADLTITISAVATADIGSSAFVKVLQYVSAGYATTPSFNIQTGPNQGNSISFGLANVSASALRIGGVNLIAQSSSFNALAAQDALGQIDQALSRVLTVQANIGAVGVRLTQEADNDNLASVNLQASESSIRDLNVSQASTAYTKAQLLISFGTSLLAQANTNSQSVLQLFR